MGDGGEGGVRREFLLCLYGMLIHHKLVPPPLHFIRFPYSVMLRLYTYGGGEGGGTVRVMYATQEHNLISSEITQVVYLPPS